MPLDDADIPYSDAWWLRRLVQKMHTPELRPNGQRMTRVQWFDLLWSYHQGRPPLPSESENQRRMTREVLRMARAQFASIAVNALLDRTRVVGVRTNADPTSTDGDADGNDAARRVLVDNGPFVADALEYAYAMGVGYLFCGQPDEDGVPVATAEDPRLVISSHDPARPSRIRAVLKLYRDEDAGLDVAHLFMPAQFDAQGAQISPDRVRVATKKSTLALGARFTSSSWDWDDDRSGPLPVQGFGTPCVRLQNPQGMGEFEKQLDLLNRINDMIANRLWISKLQVFRQRALEDNATDDDAGDLVDEDGEPLSDEEMDGLLEADPGAVWRLPRGTKIWESQQADLTPILTSVRDDIKEFSASTFTPLHMFTPDAIAGSAEGADLAKDGLVAKAGDRVDRFTPSLAEFFRMSIAFGGGPVLPRSVMDVQWAPVQRHSLTQKSEAARAAKETGVPQRSIYTDFWEASPATADRWERERGADLFFGQETPPAPAPAA